MRPVVLQELFKLCLYLTIGAIGGLFFKQALLGMLIACFYFIFTYLKYLSKLHVWAAAPKKTELPEPQGAWGDIFEKLENLQRSNRKRKKKLAAILAEFQASTEALPDAAVVLGLRGEITWINSAAKHLLGFHAPQDIGNRLPNLIRHPSFVEYFAAGEYVGEVEAPSPIQRNVTLSYRIVPYGNGQRLLIARDVSEKRRLAEVQRDFVSNASHELRTPLTVLKGWLEMMRADAEAPELAPWRAPLTEMQAQTRRMENLVQDLLKLARLEFDVHGNRSDAIELSTLAQRAVNDAIALSNNRHQFTVHIEPQLILQGREVEVLSIFSNLLSNAIQYTPEQGRISVELIANTSGVNFAVSDTGIGIDEADLPRLTERFYRVNIDRSRASGGTGLGLSIVQHALDRHEATLHIDSKPEKGSTFTVHFPLSRLKKR